MTPVPPDSIERDPFLTILGRRLRTLRDARALTRKSLAEQSGVSERHLASLEHGVGNASILVLRQIADTLACSLAELTTIDEISSDSMQRIGALLAGRNDSELTRAYLTLRELFESKKSAPARSRRIALIGLRGAGKSTLGKKLADASGRPFIELNQEVALLAGCSPSEIHNLYGPTAFRRYERRALEQSLTRHPDAIIATPGGIVSDPATYELLLSNCLTVWLKASPAEHMARVIAQGDLRPMAGNREAMADLQHILSTRAAAYGKADLELDTSGKSTETALAELLAALDHLGDSAPG